MRFIKELEKLNDYADDFANIGDANDALIFNSKRFFEKFNNVFAYYYFIVSNAKPDSEDWYEAIRIVSEIAFYNPSLKYWVNLIIDKADALEFEEKIGRKQKKMKLPDVINNLFDEFDNIKCWDMNRIGEISWNLIELQKRLMLEKDNYNPNEFKKIMDKINEYLKKIAKVYKSINDDEISIKKGIK